MALQFMHNPLAAVGTVVAEKALTHPTNWARAGNAISPETAPQIPAPADMSAVGGKASPYAVSIPDESKIPHPGAVWTKHPSGFEFRNVEGE